MANIELERDFYNEDIKKRYLATKKFKTENQYGNIERMFLKAAKYEKELDKDASTFSVMEVKDMLKRLNFTSIYSCSNFRCQLFKYTQWCISQNIVESYINSYDSTQVGEASQYINIIKSKRKMITRKELLSDIEKLNNASDMYAILGLFEGLNGENRNEIINLRTTDIDKEKGIIHVPDYNGEKGLKKGRDIKVSEKLIQLAFEASEMEKYTALSGRQVALANDPTLIFKEFNNSSDSSSDFYKGRRLYFRLVKALGAIGLEDLSINSISDSGKIHMINEIAKKKGVSGKDVIGSSELLKLIEDQFGQELFARRSSFMSNYGEYLV